MKPLKYAYETEYYWISSSHEIDLTNFDDEMITEWIRYGVILLDIDRVASIDEGLGSSWVKEYNRSIYEAITEGTVIIDRE